MKQYLIGAVLAGLAVSLAFLSFGQPKLGLIPDYRSTLTNQANLVSAAKTLSPFTLGSVLNATSVYVATTSLSKGLNWGLALGDTCVPQLTSATSTLGFSEDGQITSITATSAIVSVTFFNGSTSTLSLSTGTLKVTCNHF